MGIWNGLHWETINGYLHSVHFENDEDLNVHIIDYLFVMYVFVCKLATGNGHRQLGSLTIVYV